MVNRSPIEQVYLDWMKKGGSANQVNISPITGASGSKKAGGGSSTASKPSEGKGQGFLPWLIDIASRGEFAVTGAVSNKLKRASDSAASRAIDVRSGKQSLGGAISEGIGEGLFVDPVKNLGADAATFWKGLTSTDPADKKYGVDLYYQAGESVAQTQGEKYKKPEWKSDPGGTVVRGATGFVADVALDPLTYVPFGPVIKAVGLASRAVKGAAAGKKAIKIDGAAAKGTVEASEAVAKGTSDVAGTAARQADGATLVSQAAAQVSKSAANPGVRELIPTMVTPKATGPMPTAARTAFGAPTIAKAIDAAAGPIPKISSAPINQLPKVSETIKQTSPGFLAAVAAMDTGIANTMRTAAEVGAEAAAKVAVRPAGKPMGVQAFVDDFFKADDGLTPIIQNFQLPGGGGRTNLFASGIGKMLANPKTRNAVQAALKQTPKGQELIQSWGGYVKAQRSAMGAATGAAKAVPVEAAAPLLGKAETPARSTFIRDMLAGLSKPEKKALDDAIPGLFKKMSAAKSPVVKEKLFDEITKLAKNADDLTPTSILNMSEDAQRFVVNELKLTPDDFDRVARQLILETELRTAMGKPPLNVLNKATAKSVPANSLSGIVASTGLSVAEITNRSQAVFKSMLGREFDPKYVTKSKGTHYYDDGVNKRLAVIDGQMNQYAFATFLKRIRKQADDTLIPKVGENGVVSAARKAAHRNAYMTKEILALEHALIESGIVMGVRVGKELFPMRLSHVYQTLTSYATKITDDMAGLSPSMIESVLKTRSQAVKRFMHNPGTAVNDTNMMVGFATAIKGGEKNAVMEALVKNVSDNNVAYRRDPYSDFWKPGTKTRTSSGKLYTAKELREEAYDLITSTAPAMRELTEQYVASTVARAVTHGAAIAEQVAKGFDEAFKLGDGPALANLAGIKDEIARLSSELGSHALGAQLAAQTIQKQVRPGIVRQAESVARTENAIKNMVAAGKSPAEVRASMVAADSKNTRVLDDAVADEAAYAKGLSDEAAAELLHPMGVKAADDISRVNAQTQSWWARVVDPFGRLFNVKYGATVDGVDIHDFYRHAASISAQNMTTINKSINAMSKRHNIVLLEGTKETALSAAFKMMQKGVTEVPEELAGLANSPAVMAAFEELGPMMGRFFDIHGVGFSGDFFLNHSTNINFMKEAWTSSGLGKYGKDPFSGIDGANFADFWKTLDIDNPTEFLTRYNSAAHRALSAKHTTDSLLTTLTQRGLVSTTAREGFARPLQSGESFLFGGLNDSKMYVDKQILDAISNVDKAWYAPRGPVNPNVFVTTLDASLRAWKTGMTIYRPGHHVRNALSNAALSYLAEGPRNLAKSGLIAADIIAARSGQGAKGIEGISEISRILSGGVEGGAASRLKTGKGEQVAFTSRGQKVTKDELHDAASSRGIFRSYQRSEDIIESGKGGIADKLADVATFKNTRVEGAVAAFSEGLDHHGTLQQFAQIVMNNFEKIGTKKFPTKKDLYDHAAKRAYRFHPDAAALSPFEAKYMRRIIPFYTWFRGTLPGVIEAAVSNPGRAAVFHKASFGAAQAQGIDAESFANPFPEGVDIPQYMRERTFGANFRLPGSGAMYSLNPGFASTDLADGFFGKSPEETGKDDEGNPTYENPGGRLVKNAAQFLTGMVNPMFKVPAELLAGVRFDSGRQIASTGDYIDEQIPYLNYLTSGTGYSLAGSIMEGKPKEQYAVEKGYRPSIFDNESGAFTPGEHQFRKGINWLLGQGAQPVDTIEDKAQKDLIREQTLALREAQGK
jgi:hypothetical protein